MRELRGAWRRRRLLGMTAGDTLPAPARQHAPAFWARRQPCLPSPQVAMSSREIFKEFEFLLEKSQRSFNRLRDLPPYGNSRWEHHFHKAFHIYSKLWKFQQDHR